MKKCYSNIPSSMANMQTYGFSWMDFITAIPSPLFVVTSYKSNEKPNACLQSWACFNGDNNGFYVIMSSVHKSGHMYKTIQEKKVAVLNFPSAEFYDKCFDTIKNNRFEDDEIALSGLTATSAKIIDAPQIEECFLNLECRYLWGKERKQGDTRVVMCLEVVNISIDEKYLDETSHGRYGENGYLYNIHYPINPENFNGKSHDWIATLNKFKDIGEY